MRRSRQKQISELSSITAIIERAAINYLIEHGAMNAKLTGKYGETRVGWWMDDVWLAPSNEPIAAVKALLGD